MEKVMVNLGRLAGFFGILVCAIAVIARLAGHYALFGLQATTLLQVGTSAAVTGSFLLLAAGTFRS